MTNLKLFYNGWNETQQAYYKPVLDVLVKNKVSTGKDFDINVYDLDWNLDDRGWKETR
jgi:hypothetical protein